jgi:hypothetical protein
MCYSKALKSHTRNASNHCRHFFKDGELVYYNNVDGLLQKLGSTHNPEEWRLFVHWSKYSFKTVQQHIGINPSIPFAHSVHIKDTYENLDLLLKATSYSKYRWKICRKLKVIRSLLGMQSGHTKFCCFLCEWGSRAKDKHYKIKNLPMQENSVPGEIDR